MIMYGKTPDESQCVMVQEREKFVEEMNNLVKQFIQQNYNMYWALVSSSCSATVPLLLFFKKKGGGNSRRLAITCWRN